MEEILKIKPEDIRITDKKILIKSISGKKFRRKLLYAGAWILFGILSVMRFLKTGDKFLLWTGLIIGIGHAGRLIYLIFWRNRYEISKKDVLEIKIEQTRAGSMMEIGLANEDSIIVEIVGSNRQDLDQKVNLFQKNK